MPRISVPSSAGTPLRGYTLNNYYGPTGAVTGSRAIAADHLRCVPYLVRESRTFDRMAIEVTTAGSAGTLFRLGIFDVNPLTGFAGAVLLDAGTVAGDAIAAVAATISWASGSSRWVYLGVAGQVLTGSPILRGFTGGQTPFDVSLASTVTMSVNNHLLYTGVSGAFTDLTAVTPSLGGSPAPCIVLRATAA